MDTFSDALLSPETRRIPDEYDWFAPLLGDWDCDYYDELFDNKKNTDPPCACSTGTSNAMTWYTPVREP